MLVEREGWGRGDRQHPSYKTPTMRTDYSQIQGAFNIFNAEGALALRLASDATGLRAFLQTSASFVKAWGAERLGGVLRSIAGPRGESRLTIHLDHCSDLALIGACIRAGWDSVMIDASALPLEENIRATRAVVDLARPAGVLVEGEIGYVGGPEDDFSAGGSPERVRAEDAVRFATESGIDLLAVGVGTSHGHYAAGVKVDVDLLEEVHQLLPEMPLVLHGGSGIPEDQVGDSVRRGGVRKINISTDIKESWNHAIRAHLDGPDPLNTGALSRNLLSALTETMSARMRLFASFAS